MAPASDQLFFVDRARAGHLPCRNDEAFLRNLCAQEPDRTDVLNGSRIDCRRNKTVGCIRQKTVNRIEDDLADPRILEQHCVMSFASSALRNIQNAAL
jgi:hypothetical protein